MESQNPSRRGPLAVRLALVLQCDWVADVTTVVRSSPSAAARVPSRVILLAPRRQSRRRSWSSSFPTPQGMFAAADAAFFSLGNLAAAVGLGGWTAGERKNLHLFWHDAPPWIQGADIHSHVLSVPFFASCVLSRCLPYVILCFAGSFLLRCPRPCPPPPRCLPRLSGS